ncbi:MAG TPA: phosphate ABC transporter permease PstA [Candidatus Tectomicrobia bacterium]|nr:phosphate ABC transporter permease PstA [Candidatus Tectomicrobia bacterium]
MKKIWKSGDPFIWLTGGALAFSLLMVAGLVLLILRGGLGFFWPTDVTQLVLANGLTILGQVVERETIPQPGAPIGTVPHYRLKVKQGNRDLYGADFSWVDEAQIVARIEPPEAVIIERREWGNLYGFINEVRDQGQVVAQGPEEGWAALQARLPEVSRVYEAIRRIETREIGAINHAQEQVRLALRRLELQGIGAGPPVQRLQRELDGLQTQYAEQAEALTRLRAGLTASVVLSAARGMEKELPIFQVVRAYRPNLMSFPEKMGFYAVKLWEFVADDPRESNTEGGVFPAIFGTVMMVLIMSLAVTPLGVIAAFYLREYAKQGPFVSAVRIAVNNLAGVPSIVFGVFGVGFFIYFVGGTIDRLFFPESLPTPTFGTGGILWASLTLALLTVPVVIVATEEGLAAIPGGMREASLALGATKFETTIRVVLPSVMPSVLTGLILAMARAAGEVAPLMITGVVKLAPALPIDGFWPFLHLERKFMHLGFHIYDVGFQSPNVDAARPMVFTTAMLLLVIVVVLNLTAIMLRNRLRKKYATSAV